MAEFINLDDDLILNIERIKKIEFVSDDFSIENFIAIDLETREKVLLDYIGFEFAKVTLLDGEIIPLNIIIYSDYEEDEELWYNQNRADIKNAWCKIQNILGIRREDIVLF